MRIIRDGLSLTSVELKIVARDDIATMRVDMYANEGTFIVYDLHQLNEAFIGSDHSRALSQRTKKTKRPLDHLENLISDNWEK